MQTYAKEIALIIESENQVTFLKNRIKRLAVERLLEIIGEAANHVSVETQKLLSDIPWTRIIGLRNKLAHDYGEILSDRIWLIATRNIRELVITLKNI